MVQMLLNALHTKMLWIVIGLLTMIAGAVTYQTQVHIREQVEQQRKAAEFRREMQRMQEADRHHEKLRNPGDMRLP
jgi:hypothetical protein